MTGLPDYPRLIKGNKSPESAGHLLCVNRMDKLLGFGHVLDH